jgi:hypothetical protein
MSSKTRLAKIESAKKANTRNGHMSPEEAARIREIKEIMDIIRGRVPMTPERQARVDQVNSEKPWNFNQTFDDLIRGAFDYKYPIDELSRIKLAPLHAKFDNQTLLYTDCWQILDALY